MGVISDSLPFFWNPFLPTVFPLPELIWGLLPSLTLTCYVVFGWYLWDTYFFLEGNVGGLNPRKKEREGAGRSRGRRNSKSDILYETRINWRKEEQEKGKKELLFLSNIGDRELAQQLRAQHLISWRVLSLIPRTLVGWLTILWLFWELHSPEKKKNIDIHMYT